MNNVPYALAVAAGMVAAVNPCAFALLPTYLALLVADRTADHGTGPGGRAGAVGRAFATTAAMTGGFVAVFGAFGLVVVPLAVSVQRHLPWVTVVIGFALVGLGGWLLAGRELSWMAPKPRLGRPARSLRWAAGYGVTYAIASLSCAVAPFLALVSAATSAGGMASGVAIFVAYAAGMGLVVGMLSVSVALARDGLAARLRRVLPYVSRGGGALLVLAGGYVAYYGGYELRVLSGDTDGDPVVGGATRVQGMLVRWLEALGAGPAAVAFAVVAAAGLVLALRRARRPRRERRP